MKRFSKRVHHTGLRSLISPNVLAEAPAEPFSAPHNIFVADRAVPCVPADSDFVLRSSRFCIFPCQLAVYLDANPRL